MPSLCGFLIANSLPPQNNNLTGTIPSFTGYRQLHILRLGNNSFVGSLPQSLPFNMRLLSLLDVSYN